MRARAPQRQRCVLLTTMTARRVLSPLACGRCVFSGHTRRLSVSLETVRSRSDHRIYSTTLELVLEILAEPEMFRWKLSTLDTGPERVPGSMWSKPFNQRAHNTHDHPGISRKPHLNINLNWFNLHYLKLNYESSAVMTKFLRERERDLKLRQKLLLVTCLEHNNDIQFWTD